MSRTYGAAAAEREAIRPILQKPANPLQMSTGAIRNRGCSGAGGAGPYAARPKDLDVPDATFTCPGLTTFARLDEPGLAVVGQRLWPVRAILACRVVVPDRRWTSRNGRPHLPPAPSPMKAGPNGTGGALPEPQLG
jgi:hypothetical protein